MAINLALVGKKSDPVPFSYNWKDVVLYALGVGAKIGEPSGASEVRRACGEPVGLSTI